MHCLTCYVGTSVVLPECLIAVCYAIFETEGVKRLFNNLQLIDIIDYRTLPSNRQLNWSANLPVSRCKHYIGIRPVLVYSAVLAWLNMALFQVWCKLQLTACLQLHQNVDMTYGNC